MNELRIVNHPVLGTMPERKSISFIFDGKTYQGLEGESIAAALLANGIRTLRVHEEKGTPRGIYCNIGHCFECRVTVNQQPGVRGCLTEIKEGMVIESGKQQPTPLKNYAEKLAQMKEGKRHV
ncbi:(2Fe-2S)-binding protein [Scopulibacillus cellulosilyticus]|uniref:(2Fe-2S)-binding protein n=1 Tax=Scopulibacillus cellulosilyticus TaxID=2665665 RepID=A0ABW2Q1L2_9BACL